MEKFKKLLQQRYQLTDTRMLCALADSITFQHLDKDVKLIVEGETAANIYFLLSGIVRGFYYNENGKEITDCFVYESGDIIASDVPMNSAPSLITEETLVPCEIAALPINKIQELMSLYPEITQMYLQCLSLNLNRHREHKIALSRYCAGHTIPLDETHLSRPDGSGQEKTHRLVSQHHAADHEQSAQTGANRTVWDGTRHRSCRRQVI